MRSSRGQNEGYNFKKQGFKSAPNVFTLQKNIVDSRDPNPGARNLENPLQNPLNRITTPVINRNLHGTNQISSNAHPGHNLSRHQFNSTPMPILAYEGAKEFTKIH